MGQAGSGPEIRRAVPRRMTKTHCLAAPARWGSSARHPAAWDPPWGHYDPCARSSLERAVGKAGPGSADRSRKMPQQSVERRAGPRHGPVISGAPEMGPLARRTTGRGASAPAPVGALLPSIFWGAEIGQRRGPARHDKRAAEHLAV